MKKLGLLALVLSLGLSGAMAEMRIWTSVKGDTIEAKFVKLFSGKVVLHTQEGKQLKVPISGLCDADKEWLANVIPPKIKISVDVDKDRDTLNSFSSEYGTYNYEKKAETTKCAVTLQKTNQEPCHREFLARMYVIGKESSRNMRKVIAYTEHTFSFKTSKTIEFRTTPAMVEYTKSNYTENRGAKYEGYLVVIEDENGGIIAIESSQSTYDKCVQKFKKARMGTMFDRDFDIMNPTQSKKKK